MNKVEYFIYAKLMGVFTLAFVAKDLDFAKAFASTYKRVNETEVLIKPTEGAKINDKDYLLF